jgi:hypothetical protein
LKAQGGQPGKPRAPSNPNYNYTIGAKLGPNASRGGHYVTFRNGVQVGGGPGIAPPIKKAVTGMHETLSRDTMIQAHANERVGT